MKNERAQDTDNSDKSENVFALALSRETVKKLLDPHDLDFVTTLNDFDYFPDLEQDQEDLDCSTTLKDQEDL